METRPSGASQPPEKPTPRPRPTPTVWLLFVILATIGVLWFLSGGPAPKEIAWDKFYNHLTKGNVLEATVRGMRIYGRLKPGVEKEIEPQTTIKPAIKTSPGKAAQGPQFYVVIPSVKRCPTIRRRNRLIPPICYWRLRLSCPCCCWSASG